MAPSAGDTLADTIFWIDLPLRATISRLLRRSFQRWRSGEPSWGGREPFWPQFEVWDPNASLVGYTLRNHGWRRRDYLAAIGAAALSRTRFEQFLRARDVVERCLTNVADRAAL